jgi:hypothetical protein
MVEFNCCECKRHIVAVGLEKIPQPPLCAVCIFLPSWFEDQRLRAMLDPEWTPPA